MRAPYKPGDHCHTVALTDRGTALVSATVVDVARNFDGGRGPWTVRWTNPTLTGVRHANVDNRGEGDYMTRRAHGCLKCVVSGRVQDGTATPITEMPA